MPRSPLTKRQWLVIQLVRAGKSNKQIARELAISEAGVKKHLEALFRRYGATNRVTLVVRAADERNTGPTSSGQ